MRGSLRTNTDPLSSTSFKRGWPWSINDTKRTFDRNNALDFGDLLNFVTILFRRFPEVLRSYQELCRYVMVDEFQDTNLIQYHLIRQMVEQTSQSSVVVGDDDQSIYRWRGAEIGNILNFEKDFPEARVITLEQNYRSTQNILQAANHDGFEKPFREREDPLDGEPGRRTPHLLCGRG